ncbi:MAG: UDP-3-O-acyl-N-acetylglucosamine deacetylase [Proteobacteria bacterium]|nr:UDP-3-O-acyl-N-acetylglucosamine deacetylase [Pseudomonadota bacterium]
MPMPYTIFVVDDQESICQAVKSVLTDESYRILTFSSAEALQEGLQVERPDLILLDIWLPGIDGVEALGHLKAQYPSLAVILMSGHAGIDIAVKAMKAGASDFLEKPLNLDILLEKVAAHLPVTDASSQGLAGVTPAVTTTFTRGSAASLIQSQEPQRTVRNNAVLNGVGLLSGRPTGVIISPAPINSGIVFRTKVDEEIPNIDGSAADFCRIISAAGIEEQAAKRIDVVIHKKMVIGSETLSEKHLYVEPFDGFEVIMRVDYPAPILEQSYRFTPTKQSFETEIAPARSFNTFENIDHAQQQGMVGSGYLNSHIIIHDGKVINTKLNFPDEFVRHKILDLLGDLYLIGHGLRGRVIGNMSSHGFNQALALKIHEALPN